MNKVGVLRDCVEKPPKWPSRTKVKPLPLSLSLPRLTSCPSQPSTTTSSVLRIRRDLHSRQPSSSKSALRPEESSFDGFALAEYRKQEIRRARGPLHSQWPCWFIDSWQEEELAEKKSSLMTEDSLKTREAWETALCERLRLRKLM